MELESVGVLALNAVSGEELNKVKDKSVSTVAALRLFCRSAAFKAASHPAHVSLHINGRNCFTSG